MSQGSGLPLCWLCKHIDHKDKYCTLHKIVIPVKKGYTICKDYSDVDNSGYENKNQWFVEFRTAKLMREDLLYVYHDYSSEEEYIPFSELRKD